MSSASNTFERVYIVTMAMLKYVKRKARPSNEQSILSQQDVKAVQKSVDRPY